MKLTENRRRCRIRLNNATGGGNPMNKKLWALLILAVLPGCVSPRESDPALGTSFEAVYDRASLAQSYSPEKDEAFLENTALTFSRYDDETFLRTLEGVEARRASAMRIFFRSEDFRGESRLAVGQKPKTLDYLNSLPIPEVWPMEIAVAEDWGQPGLRLDWKCRIDE